MVPRKAFMSDFSDDLKIMYYSTKRKHEATLTVMHTSITHGANGNFLKEKEIYSCYHNEEAYELYKILIGQQTLQDVIKKYETMKGCEENNEVSDKE